MLMSGTMEDLGVIEIEDEDYEEEEHDSENEEDESEYESDDIGEEDGMISSVAMTSPRVSNLVPRSGNSQEGAVLSDDFGGQSTDMKLCKGRLRSEDNGGDDGVAVEEIDGLTCIICMEAWSSSGEHQICCLPCGHLYGLSCIKKWLQQRRSSGKCPQCNKRCTLKDVRVLYAARLCVVDAELQKRVQSLEARCASLQQKNADCCKKEAEAKEREAKLHLKVQELKKKTDYLLRLLEDRNRESPATFNGSVGYQRRVTKVHHGDYGAGTQSCSGIFMLQDEFQVAGGRLFDMDASDQVMIVARRLGGIAGTNVLTKISLVAPNERDDIQLPPNSKAVRALCLRPCSRMALVACLGKKLSVLSTESKNTVLTYDLPAPPWSCSWGIDGSYHVYTGLQNGMVLAFDMRQTSAPMESMIGLTSSPVHTVAPIGCGTTTVLSASKIGVCEWNIGGRVNLIPESENQGVCISVAHCGDGGDIVASFRPRIDVAGCPTPTPTPTPCMDDDAYRVEGCHVLYKRSGNQSYRKTATLGAQVDGVRLPKSIIIVNKQQQNQNHRRLFVCGNEELVLHDLSNLEMLQRLETPKNQIWDVRWSELSNTSLLGCLSGDVVQLFTC